MNRAIGGARDRSNQIERSSLGPQLYAYGDAMLTDTNLFNHQQQTEPDHVSVPGSCGPVRPRLSLPSHRTRAQAWALRVGCPAVDHARLRLMFEMERANRG